MTKNLQVKVGDKIKCLMNSSKYYGKILTVTKGGTGYNQPIHVRVDNSDNWALYSGQFELAKITIKDFLKGIDELEEKTLKLTLRINWMKKNNIEEFDEETFKIYKALLLIKEKGSDIEKAKLLTDLFK